MERGIDCEETPWESEKDSNEFQEEIEKHEHHGRLSMKPLSICESTVGMWKVFLKQNKISGLQFIVLPSEKSPMSAKSMTSDPGLLYPCQFLSDHTVSNVAYIQQKVHWMLRLLASKPACCAFARGANVRSSFAIPVWFFDQERMTMSDFDICKSIQSEWQLPEDDSDIEVYACLCTPRVSQLTMMVDWKSRGATDYAFRDGMFIHSTSMPEVKAIMFCTKTHQLIQPGQRCEHFCECRHMKTKFCLR